MCRLIKHRDDTTSRFNSVLCLEEWGVFGGRQVNITDNNMGQLK